MLTILWVVILKWCPVYFTPLMLIRQAEALLEREKVEWHYEWVSYEEISPNLAICVIASEDQRFPTHFGIDTIAIKQVIKESKQGKKLRGASTISQQVAKNVFLWNGRNYIRKGLELYFTILIESIWDKRRILEVYMNVAEMGKFTFGAEASAKRFYFKSAKDLNLYEAATLTAVLPNPFMYQVRNPNETVLWKRNWIIQQVQLLGGLNYIKDI